MKLLSTTDIAETIEKLGEFLFGLPLYYLILRILFGGMFWLVEGVWREFTPCISFNFLCPERITGLAGLDKIIAWFGDVDVFFSLLLLCPVGFYISIRAANWKSSLEKKQSK